jgi:hypothetical protein
MTLVKEERRGSRLIGMDGRLREFAFELFKDSFTGVGDGGTPEVGFPAVMERHAWRESHHGTGAASEDDGRFFGFPAIGAAIRALVRGLVEVLGSLADFDDICEGFFVKAPVGIRVEFPVRVRVTDHFLERRLAAFESLERHLRCLTSQSFAALGELNSGPS